MAIQKILNNFYIKVLIKGWGICCLIWSFMILQFWWGNHDWEFLKYGISLTDGFFEARFSIHLFYVIFLCGQIIPVLMQILSLGGIAGMSVLSGIYLKLPRKESNFLLFILMIGIMPYTAILFYYAHYTFSLALWGVVSVCLLFFMDTPYKLWKFLLGVFLIVLLLGSYPPVIALTLVLFVGKQIQSYVLEQENFKNIFHRGIFLFFVFFIAAIVYLCIFKSFFSHVGMYNTRFDFWEGLIKRLIFEFFAFFTDIADFYKFGGWAFIFLFIVSLAVFFCFLFKKSTNKILFLVMFVGLILVSKIAFLLSEAAYIARYRVYYWGIAGFLMVMFCTVLQHNKRCVGNLYLSLVCATIFLFVNIDFEIQKLQYLGFRAERVFHKRLVENITLRSNYQNERKYVTLSVGYPDFRHRYCVENCAYLENEFLSSVVLPTDLGLVIFWDENVQQTAARLGFWNNQLWFVPSFNLDNAFLQANEKNLYDLRQWLSIYVKKYPNPLSIYLDDTYIIFNLDEILFNRHKLLIYENLVKKWM